jgi:NAD(P)H dehydrogenase (quinone)
MPLDAGLPAPFAALLVDCDLGASRGELVTASTDLQRPVPFC